MALMQGFTRLYSDAIECKVEDGFLLGGLFIMRTERLYNTCVKHFPWLWNIIYKASAKHKEFINKRVSCGVRKKFLRLLESYKPDLIISLHPLFVGSLLNILKSENISTPFYVLVTDLVTISDMWIDGRADKIFVPSQEAADCIAQGGVDKAKILAFGIPVREGFETDIINKEDIIKNTSLDKRMRVLLLNNTEKATRLIRIVNGLYERCNCDVTLVCGRNKRTFAVLTRFFRLYSYKPAIIGYTEELNKLFLSCDALITRSGTITIVEAINCLIPIVSMGALPGQEEGNPAYIDKNGLGFMTSSTDDIFNKIDFLLQDNRSALIEVRRRQFDYCGKNAREMLVRYIADELLS